MPVIRETRKIFTQPIGVRSFDTGEQNVGRAISNFADKAGQEFYERAQINAEKFGTEAAQSVSTEDLKVFDPSTGKPEVLSSMDGMGSIASSAFEQVVERRFVDSVDKDIRLKSAELASKYEDPIQYQRMFESYLGSMAKGADDRFKNVIMDSGSYVMGSTKIQLADAARAKSRAAAAQNVATTNEEYSETIYDISASGQREAAVVMIEERITASVEAEKAELYKPGYSTTVRSNLGAQAMSGALQVAMQNSTPVQQAAMQAYIGSQGLIGADDMTQAQREALEPFIGYVDRNNTRAILSEAGIISSNLNAITAAKASEQAAKYKQAALEFGRNYNATDIMPNRANAAMNSKEAWASGEQSSVIGSINSADDAYQKSLREISFAQQQGLGTEASNALRQDSRRAGLDAAIIGMASDGNIDALKKALVTGDPQDIARLSTLQQAALITLQGSMLYDPAEDRNYVGTLLSGTQNEVQDRIDREIRNANLFTKVSNESTRFLNGVYDSEAVAEAEALAAAALASGDITANEYDSLSGGLRSAAGKGIANIVSANMSSFDMNALANYVSSGGQETLGTSVAVAKAGNLILGTVPEDKRSSVVNHINSVREKVSRKEAEILKAQEEINNINRIRAGAGNVTSKDDRKIQSKILADQGYVLTDPSTYATEEKRADLFQAMRETPSQELIDGLKNIALGLETPGSDAFLDLFSVLSNDLTSTGLFVNRFGSGEGAPISAKETAFLQAVIKVKQTEGGSAKEIAMALKDKENDEKSKLNIGLVFGDQTPRQYLASEFKSDIIAAELGDTAEYLALMGGSEKDVKARLEEIVDTYYHNTRVVVDPRFPVGEISRTMYSLEKMFPNEARRDAFIDIIVSELPDGYRLRNYATRAPSRIQVPAGIAMQGNLDLEIGTGVTATAVGDQPEQKDVYLVPNEATVGAAYYAYYVDDNNELRPLIMEIDGQPDIPMWDESELADYDAQALIDRNAQIESQLDVRESVLEAVRKRPGMRSFSEVGNITFGRGGN